MKDCRWLKPEAVAEIKFSEWTEGGIRRKGFHKRGFTGSLSRADTPNSHS